MKTWMIVFAALMGFTTGILEAQQTTVNGIHGTWWNPEYDGEGFVFEQYENGLVIGYWYTYDHDGNQLWMIGTGELLGDHVDLEMSIAEGGLLGSTQNSTSVIRELWGIVSLDLVSCQKIEMNYEGVDGSVGAYNLERLVYDGLASTSCINLEAPKAALQDYDWFSGWRSRSIPLIGTSTLRSTIVGGGPRIDHFTYRLIAAKGDIKIKSLTAIDASGITNPSIEGLSENMVIKEGEAASFALTSGFTGGKTVQLNYMIQLYELGTVIDLDVSLTTN